MTRRISAVFVHTVTVSLTLTRLGLGSIRSLWIIESSSIPVMNKSCKIYSSLSPNAPSSASRSKSATNSDAHWPSWWWWEYIYIDHPPELFTLFWRSTESRYFNKIFNEEKNNDHVFSEAIFIQETNHDDLILWNLKAFLPWTPCQNDQGVLWPPSWWSPQGDTV